MIFLFLDIEITGFDLSFDQILELGGAICELKQNKLQIKSTFSTLIKPTIDIPDNIPRLTGLDAVDFIDAPHLTQAQKLWQDWVDSNQLYDNEVVVIGHSVATDINFLKVNRFWLPSPSSFKPFKSSKSETIPYCDSLDLAKILLPDQSNLNLEYLVKNLQLDEKVIQNVNNFNNSLNFKDLKPHRALFDTLTGIEFFNFCMKRIEFLNLPQIILDLLFEVKILPTRIISLALPLKSFSTQNKDQEIPQNNSITQVIDFNGQPVQLNLNENLEQNDIVPQQILDLIENPKLPHKLKLASLQIYIYLTTKLHFPNTDTRLHTYGTEERTSLEIVTEFLTQSDQDTQENITKSQDVANLLPVFERILSSIDQLVEVEFEFAKFSFWVDFLAQAYALEFEEEFEPKVSIDMDFLAARMETVLQQHPKKELPVNRPGQNNDLDLNDVFNLFQKVCEKFAQLSIKLKGIPKSAEIVNFLASKISESLDKFATQNWVKNPFIIRLSKNNLKLTKLKSDFNWDDYWVRLSQIPNLSITTFLDQNGWKLLGDMVSIPDDLYEIPNDFVECLRTTELEMIQSDQNTENLLKQTKDQIQDNTVSLVLCGQNSGLDKVIEYSVSNFKPGQFLAMGETGSLAKISGKIRMGFSGLVVIKSADLFMIKQIPNLKLNPSVLLIQPPYLNLNQFWFQNRRDSKDVINQTKRILRNSIVGQLGELGAKTVIYQPEIIR
jgi:DNA polymerase III epsilon subunit-like protein